MASVREKFEFDADDMPPLASAVAPRKKLVRKPAKDYSQRLRRAVQHLFLGLNLVIGVQFYLFVRYFETGGRSVAVPRPAGVDGWLPIGGMMNLKEFVVTGVVPRIHPSAMFLLLAFLLVSIVFRKSFCSWLCPVGTLSEWLWKLGRRLFRNPLRLPRAFDVSLRSLKYILLGLFVTVVAGMSAMAIRAFLEGPYGMIADVKMLNFFRHMGIVGIVTLTVLAALSVVIQNFWCRYLCPYGALMGLVSLFSPARIRRDPESCIDCAKCSRACPALLAVDQGILVRSAECTACLECVAACPAKGALQLSVPGKRSLPPWALATGIAAIFLGVVIAAQVFGVWQTHISNEVYFYLVPQAQHFLHPY
jgi:polyferredoxin